MPSSSHSGFRFRVHNFFCRLNVEKSMTVQRDCDSFLAPLQIKHETQKSFFIAGVTTTSGNSHSPVWNASQQAIERWIRWNEIESKTKQFFFFLFCNKSKGNGKNEKKIFYRLARALKWEWFTTIRLWNLKRAHIDDLYMISFVYLIEIFIALRMNFERELHAAAEWNATWRVV